MHGWMGRVLKVDLGAGTAEEEAFDPAVWRAFLGGRGFGARYLWDAWIPGADPLGPGAPLVLAVGPLTGTRTPASPRYSLSFVSPLTGAICDANAGGRFGVLFKKCGLDALIVTGRAKTPVTLAVTDDGVRIEDAADLWGKDTSETTGLLLSREDPRAGALCIGPAGENGVLFASVINEKAHALGRGGAGAVFGSKNLKGVTAKGSRKIAVADPEKMKFFTYEANKLVRAHPLTSKGLPELGTSVVMNVIHEAGILPVRNFRENDFEAAPRFAGETIASTLQQKTSGCMGCVIRCKRETKTARDAGEGPEYETAWALGPDLMIDDLETVAEAGYLCNRLGLDTISTGGTIAAAMELAERGAADLGIRFGEKEKLLETVEAIASRAGAGDALAQGSRRLAATYGADDAAMQVKGLELPGYDPRGSQGQGLGYATSNRGGCHLRGGYLIAPEVLGVPRLIDRFSAVGKAGYAVRAQDLGAVADALSVCRFSTFAVSEIVLARLLSAVTGEAYDPEDLMTAGERIHTLERLFNLREGFTSADDTLPARLTEEPSPGSGSKRKVVDLDLLLQEYYAFRGWTAEGVPAEETLGRLGLEFADHGRRAVQADPR